MDSYFHHLKAAVSHSIQKKREVGYETKVAIYDAILPWALDSRLQNLVSESTIPYSASSAAAVVAAPGDQRHAILFFISGLVPSSIEDFLGSVS
ncbi:hypothetical protein TIFTF001_005796 [Ficus carica]|uniref:Uncharacterized protein n=1 Tax=Ficus carica TaxID=3494 RepID=A0AA87ZPN5_FICCA|nr:hypothetical protein TIFTF001_005796 [Ficus carica]